MPPGIPHRLTFKSSFSSLTPVRLSQSILREDSPRPQDTDWGAIPKPVSPMKAGGICVR